MVDTLRQAGEDNTTALVTGMRNLAAQRKLEGLPTFSGDSNCPLVIDEWFKIAERVARLADWTDPQKLAFFQEKLTKSAANFNDSLTDVQRQTYAVWKPLVIQGLSDDTIKAVKKCELKELQQDPTERVRDFQKRIDDMYKLAYGEGPATSNDANVILVRNDTKKEVLLQGLRKEIAALVWNRLDANATYADAVQTAMDSEKVIEVKKLAQSKDINSAVTAITKESEKTAGKIKELEELVKKLSIPPTATTQATRPIDFSDPAVIAAFNTYNNARTNFPRHSVRFPDSNRSRSVSPFTYDNRLNRPPPNATSPPSFNVSRPENNHIGGIVCYSCGKRGHISRECWGKAGRYQNRRQENPRFSQDSRRYPTQFSQQWRQGGDRTEQNRSRNVGRFDQSNNAYGRNPSRERGQSSERISQDYRNAPPRNPRR
jgi:hypothetical protein